MNINSMAIRSFLSKKLKLMLRNLILDQVIKTVFKKIKTHLIGSNLNNTIPSGYQANSK